MLTNIMQDKKKKKLLFDACLIFALLILSGVFLLISRFCLKDGSYAVVTVDGIEVARYPLSVDGEYPLNGGTNLLVIQNGKACIRDAGCPDKLCVRQGKISRVGQKLICLPNRLTVEIIGEPAEDDPDLILCLPGGETE